MRGRSVGPVIAGVWLAGAVLLAGARSAGEEPSPPFSAADVKARWHSRLDARHFTARLLLEMKLAGMDETRALTVYRTDEDGRGERVLVRFDRPPDLRDVRLLYREVAGRPNEYFLYTPSTRRVRRLPPSLTGDDLYGVDLEFLGFGTSEVRPTEGLALAPDTLEGRPVHRLSERALDGDGAFDDRTTWLDPATFVPLRTELRRRGQVTLVARTHEVRVVQGVPTPIQMSFVRPGQEREVRLHVESVDYETPLGEEVFSILNLTRRRRELADR
jgi:hypothetical protein